jgi:hypothetical protein
MLNRGGKFLVMTEPLMPSTDFSDWHYKNDATHVFFYRPRPSNTSANGSILTTARSTGRLDRVELVPTAYAAIPNADHQADRDAVAEIDKYNRLPAVMSGANSKRARSAPVRHVLDDILDPVEIAIGAKDYQ